VLDYWQNAKRLAWGQEHPMLGARNDEQLRHTLPILIHLDGAEIYTNKEFWVLSFSSPLITNVHVLDAKFQICKLPYAAIKDPELQRKAIDTLVAYCKWNFDVLNSGTVPSIGFYKEPLGGALGTLAGSPIMGAFTAICSGFKSDLKAKRELHGYPQHYNATRICERCHATQGFQGVLRDPDLCRLLYTDVSPDAPWRSTRTTHANCHPSPWPSIMVPHFTFQYVGESLPHNGVTAEPLFGGYSDERLSCIGDTTMPTVSSRLPEPGSYIITGP
jgi:hypothetical protein